MTLPLQEAEYHDEQIEREQQRGQIQPAVKIQAQRNAVDHEPVERQVLERAESIGLGAPVLFWVLSSVF